MTIAFHTLGCKVNQYDTQAMRELLEAAGHRSVSFQEDADAYVINTCTVTGTGDRKSLQLARRVRREHPGALLVLCGCLAQRQGEKLMEETGADLILGTQRRGEIAQLIARTAETRQPLCAVSPLTAPMAFESLQVTEISGHTRAAVKIQEGCNNRCTYCVIPSVRGPIRSRPLEDLRAEALRLRDAGFREIVLTGIHLASYGRERADGSLTLTDAIRTVHEIEGIRRIRLGSLEPAVATAEFCRALGAMPKVCPQFHLALQSGSDTVLARMKRRYNSVQYLAAVERIREVYPRAALTTDVLTGFPGETEAEYEETREMIRMVGFARIHVFPYSPREGTPAAGMPGQLSPALKEQRARELIRLGESVARTYLETWLGQEAELLPEEQIQGRWEGYTPEYIRVSLPEGTPAESGTPIQVLLTGLLPGGMAGEPATVSR